MTLVSLTVPDDPAAVAGWLERRLVAADFGRFVSELAAASPTRGSVVPVRQLLGPRLPAVLADGLGPLPPDALRYLLRHPPALLDLQELVLAEGGPYWDRLADAAADLGPAVDRGRRRLDDILAADAPVIPQRVETVRSYRRLAMVMSALAAGLLVTVGVLATRDRGPAAGGVAWGWAKPGGIPADRRPAGDYLDALASAADQWFDQRPADPAGLAKRLNEMRAGCSQLILAAHDPLAAGDRDWLVERCKAWAGKLDAHLADLESRRKDAAAVRADADDTVTKLATALRERARQAG